MFVSNLQSPKTGRPVANQYGVILNDGTKYFQSYSSIIAKREPSGEYLLAKDAWLSRTTKKYLKVFCDATWMTAKDFNQFIDELKRF